MKRRIAFFSLMVFLTACTNAGAPPATPQPDHSSTPRIQASAADPPTDAPPTGMDPPALSAAPTATAEENPSPSVTPGLQSVSLAFVGDIMLGRTIADRIKSGNGSAIFASVESVLRSADLAVGNLECAVGSGGVRAPKYYTFLAPPESASLLKDAGFDLLSLANNHSFDYGVETFQEAGRLFEENGIRTVGAGLNERQARTPVIFEVGGLRVGFLAYVEVPPEFIGGFDPKVWTAGPQTPGVAWAEDEKIREDIHMLESEVEYLVVLFHFGDENIDVTNERQIQLSKMAIDYGADLIVGAHTHVLQRMEEYRGRWIFYGLGNFVFDDFYGKFNRSEILWIHLMEGRSPEYSLIPLSIINGIPVIGE